MGAKGEQTRQLIRTKAYAVFAKKGYKEVTMKDICEITGLSRGGLYRHYESTEQIFLEILNGFLDRQQNEFQSKIQDHVPASVILDEILTRYEKEMPDSGNSLSIAIYEFFSNPEISKRENALWKQYLCSKEMWVSLIEYGMNTGEFKNVDPEAVFDLIAFSYQGIRMYSKMMELDKKTPQRVIKQIQSILAAE
ncbi:MAG: TetR/AcrR family transcriptional regulator [Lachnospiraceae bacterium]|nr:TetR/AcrR family transcriptional regulator [Lachnospiraceae bacterium]